MKKKEGGGGKLNRGEIVQTRLNAKLRFAAEMMARDDRRTISSFIEQLVETAAKSHFLKRDKLAFWAMRMKYSGHPAFGRDKITVENFIKDLWVYDEPIRFIIFANCFPNLLNEAEESLIRIINETKYFWTFYFGQPSDPTKKTKEWIRIHLLEGLIKENLVEYWDKLKNGKVNEDELLKLPMGKTVKSYVYPPHETTRDDDIRVLYENTMVSNSEPLKEEEITAQTNEFWLKNAESLKTIEKVELQRTQHGTKLVKIFALPPREELTKILKNNNAVKKEKTHYDDKIHKTNPK